MTWLDTSLLLLGVAFALAVLAIERNRINSNPLPTYPKPAAPPAPPPVRNTRKTDMETMTITKIQLEEALRRWEHDARDGKTISHAEADALPVEQVASESADHLWTELVAVTAVPA